jgi:hypothetical protein
LKRATQVVSVEAETLSITHVCDGAEVVVGDEDGQAWVATFATRITAQQFVEAMKGLKVPVFGERSTWCE